jgi:hypothetical protein
VRITKPRLRSIVPIFCTGLLVACCLGSALAASLSNARVLPQVASANSKRWFAVEIATNTGSETLVSLRVYGGLQMAPAYSNYAAAPFQGTGGNLVLFQAGAGWNSYLGSCVSGRLDMGSSFTNNGSVQFGPFCGARNVFDERIADWPYVNGWVNSPGSSITRQDNGATHSITFEATWRDNSGNPIGPLYATATYQTVSDNDDLLEWNVPDDSGTTIDPISVGPVEVLPDHGAGSSNYTFRVKYRSGLYSGLNLSSQWGNHYDSTTDTWLDQTGYARDYNNDRGSYTPAVMLVIDGQHWAPHYMVPESGSVGWSEGVVYRYTVLPTDYQNFLDNIFLLPFDLPGSDPWDRYAVPIHGRPTSNNYVSFAAGKHTYEFWCTDDLRPVGERAWVQVGWPGNDCHTEYLDPVFPNRGSTVLNIRTGVQRKRISWWRQSSPNAAPAIQGVNYTDSQLRRFNDTSVDTPDPYGYSYKSHEASSSSDIADPNSFTEPVFRKLPDVNPVLTAYPFFGLPGREGGISSVLPTSVVAGYANHPDFTTVGTTDPSVYRGFIENALPNNSFLIPSVFGSVAAGASAPYYGLAFPPEIGAGPDPLSSPRGPWKYTNDDTVLPNFANIWDETAANPFRGGKWTQSTKYTLRINYWQSNNVAPRYARVYIRKNNVSSGPGAWQAFTMQKFDPSDGNYTDGAVYQYQFTPDQLPEGGGVGDYNYYFEANDGTRTTRFPERPPTFNGIRDPGDIGTATSDAGESYYWLRVNRPPVLSNQSVTPTVGRSGENYLFRVRYSDQDGARMALDGAGQPILNTTPKGDRPFVARLYVDVFGDTFGQHALTATPSSDTTLDYSVSGTGVHGSGDLTNLYVVMQTGSAARRIYRIVSNTANTITLASNGDKPGSLLTDGASVGDTFYIAQRTDMTRSADASLNPDPDDYASGVVWEFNTATQMILKPGVHRYFFEFADDWGSWRPDPIQADQRVEGEYVRYPNAGEFVGPEVIQNTAPELMDFRYTPNAGGAGADGVTVTPFTFYVTYKDDENDPPSFVRLGIDGTASSPVTTLDLFPANPADTVYTDGAIYQSSPILLSEGQHIIRAQASDGEFRYPQDFPLPQALPFNGPLARIEGGVTANSLVYQLGAVPFPDHRLVGVSIRMQEGPAVGATYQIADNVGTTLSFVTGTDLVTDGVAAGQEFIFEGAAGPLVEPNTAPTLKLGTPPLDPTEGRQTTVFTYRVTYFDEDQYSGVRGNPPKYVQVYIDNVAHNMVAVDSADQDFTAAGGGAAYEYQATNLVAGTPHTYFFVASDGQSMARLPVGSGRYDGPAVVEPPGGASNLLVRDTPADNGGSLDFQFTASLDDGGGARNVVQYLLFRNLAGAPFNEDAVTHDLIRVIPASALPSYSGKDTTVVTGTNYFYTVRAYNGATPISTNPDGTPARKVDGTLVTPINPDRVSGDSNVEGPVAAADNVQPGAATNLAVVNPGLGGTLDLSFTRSPDDGAGVGDVKGYNIYRNTTGAPFTGLPIGTVTADGSAAYSYRDQNGLTDGVLYYYVVRAFDDPAGTHESADSNVASQQSTDNNGPEIINLIPAAQTPPVTDVPQTSTISFDVRDFGAGPDLTQITVAVKVNGTTVTGTLAITPISASVAHVVWTPPAPFELLADVNVTITAGDKAVPVPGNQTVLTYNFIVQGPPVYTISGKILDAGGLPLPVTPTPIRVTAGSFWADVDASGNYQITGLAAGTYTVVPSLADHAFTPETRSVTVGPSQGGINFVVKPAYDIVGTVRTPTGGPLAGVKITDGVHEVISDAAGNFTLADLPAGDYTLVPQLAGYTFSPAGIDITLPAVPNPPGTATVAFIGDVEKFTVSGSIKTSAGTRLGGALVEAHAGTATGPVVGSATTTASGTYGVSGLPGGVYVMVPTKAGYTFDPTTRSVDIAANKSNVDFIAVPLYSVTLAPGLQMIGLPIYPSGDTLNPALLVPAGVNVARWDPTLGTADKYIRGNPGSPLPTQYEMLPGRGFWMRNVTSGPLALSIAGDTVPTTVDFALGLESGWNMAANMFDKDLLWSQLNISPGQAVRDYGFLYDTATGTYKLVTDMLGIGTSTTVPKNAGFWIKSTAKRTVGVRATVASADDVAAKAIKLTAGDYLIPIVVQGNGRADASSVAGVVKAADTLEYENPPAVSPYVDLYFLNDRDERLACDVRSTGGAQQWKFAVATDMDGATIELSLPDLSGVPNDLTVTLVDKATGKRVYARTMGRYTFTADAGGVRQFALEVAPRGEGGLVVSGASASAGTGGAVVSYSLSRPAQVEVTVMNMAGRPVRTLASSGVSAAGAGTVAWNLQTSAGTRAPAGRYLVRVRAEAEDGQVAQVLTTLQVSR